MRFAILTAATITAAVVAIPILDHLPHLCFYQAATGHLCIFCGMTHALVCVAHRDWSGAWAANPAWFAILPAFVLTLSTRGRMTWVAVTLLLLGTLLRW
jgi:hypothetical protein